MDQTPSVITENSLPMTDTLPLPVEWSGEPVLTTIRYQDKSFTLFDSSSPLPNANLFRQPVQSLLSLIQVHFSLKNDLELTFQGLDLAILSHSWGALNLTLAHICTLFNFALSDTLHIEAVVKEMSYNFSSHYLSLLEKCLSSDATNTNVEAMEEEIDLGSDSDDESAGITSEVTIEATTTTTSVPITDDHSSGTLQEQNELHTHDNSGGTLQEQNELQTHDNSGGTLQEQNDLQTHDNSGGTLQEQIEIRIVEVEPEQPLCEDTTVSVQPCEVQEPDELVEETQTEPTVEEINPLTYEYQVDETTDGEAPLEEIKIEEPEDNSALRTEDSSNSTTVQTFETIEVEELDMGEQEVSTANEHDESVSVTDNHSPKKRSLTDLEDDDERMPKRQKVSNGDVLLA